MEAKRGERHQIEGRRCDRGKQVEVWTGEAGGGGKRQERIGRKGEAEGKRQRGRGRMVRQQEDRGEEGEAGGEG
jgi:hypothetical protein